MMEAVRSVAWLADLHTQMAYQKEWTENEMLAGKSQKERNERAKKKPWRMNDFMNERKLKSSSLGPRCVGSYHPGLRTSFSWELLRDSPGIVIWNTGQFGFLFRWKELGKLQFDKALISFGKKYSCWSSYLIREFEEAHDSVCMIGRHLFCWNGRTWGQDLSDYRLWKIYKMPKNYVFFCIGVVTIALKPSLKLLFLYNFNFVYGTKDLTAKFHRLERD